MSKAQTANITANSGKGRGRKAKTEGVEVAFNREGLERSHVPRKKRQQEVRHDAEERKRLREQWTSLLMSQGNRRQPKGPAETRASGRPLGGPGYWGLR